MDLFSPQIEITTERFSFTKGIEIEINSNEDTAYDWAKLRFVSPFEQVVTIKKRERVGILLGYNGALSAGFTGYAMSDLTTGNDGNEVILRDAMLLLEAVRVNNTFLNITPQEVISYVANLAGVTKMRLDQTAFPPLACLPIFEQSGAQVLRSLGGFWGISPKLFFQDDTLFWGTAAKQTEVYHFEYGKNIVSLNLAGGFWELETVSVPFVKHSQNIKVTHPKISGDFKVSRVRVTTKPSGFVRTILYFKGA